MLEFSNVDYDAGNKKILHQIDFKVDDGETITIIGPSGSGKSTILKLAAKIISPSTGEIIFNKQKVAEIPSPSYRQDVSYCFQQPVLFGEEVADSFKFVYDIHGKQYDETHVKETLASLDLKSEILSQKVSELSGGEKQRIALARNTLFLPKILLLDEVTTGLDLTTKNLILAWLADLNERQNVTMIKVTHEEDEISQSNRILEVKDGGIINGN